MLSLETFLSDGDVPRVYEAINISGKQLSFLFACEFNRPVIASNLRPTYRFMIYSPYCPIQVKRGGIRFASFQRSIIIQLCCSIEEKDDPFHIINRNCHEHTLPNTTTTTCMMNPFFGSEIDTQSFRLREEATITVHL